MRNVPLSIHIYAIDDSLCMTFNKNRFKNTIMRIYDTLTKTEDQTGWSLLDRKMLKQANRANPAKRWRPTPVALWVLQSYASIRGVFQKGSLPSIIHSLLIFMLCSLLLVHSWKALI